MLAKKTKAKEFKSILGYWHVLFGERPEEGHMLLKNLLVGLTGSHFVDGQEFTILVARQHELIYQNKQFYLKREKNV